MSISQIALPQSSYTLFLTKSMSYVSVGNVIASTVWRLAWSHCGKLKINEQPNRHELLHSQYPFALFLDLTIVHHITKRDRQPRGGCFKHIQFSCVCMCQSACIFGTLRTIKRLSMHDI